MHARRHVPLVVAGSLVVSLLLSGLATLALAGPPASVPVEPLPAASTIHRGQEQPGSLVLLRVQALVPEKVTLSDPAQRTVQATVLAIDKEHHQIRLQTDAGQRLLLFLPPEALARLSVGAPCLLQVAPRSPRDTARAAEPVEAFW